MLLDPQVNANALTWAADAHKARTSTNVSVGKGSSLVRGVELRGLEPLTPCLQSRCAANCAIAPSAGPVYGTHRAAAQRAGHTPQPAPIARWAEKAPRSPRPTTADIGSAGFRTVGTLKVTSSGISPHGENAALAPPRGT